MKKISLLGSTGSIGKQALDVIKQSENMQIKALAVNTNIKELEKQAREFGPEVVCVYNENLHSSLKTSLADTNIKVVSGMQGLCEISSLDSINMVLNSVVGMIGLKPTLCAIEAGKDIALANKETLVTGGELVISAAKKNDVKILPVDSEHSAIFQSLQGNRLSDVKKIILTASGGPFFGMNLKQLENVTVKDALKHPNWSMGSKITIDSATMMNKGLELIEAVWLFDKKPSDIEVVVHRESILHSAVEYFDGAVIGQFGAVDMRLPIQYALTYPERKEGPIKKLSLTDIGTLTFKKPDENTFTCLLACKKAIEKGGLFPAFLNAANEEAVSLFLEGKISFNKIGEIAMSTLSEDLHTQDISLESVLSADKCAREMVRNKFC